MPARAPIIPRLGVEGFTSKTPAWGRQTSAPPEQHPQHLPSHDRVSYSCAQNVVLASSSMGGGEREKAHGRRKPSVFLQSDFRSDVLSLQLYSIEYKWIHVTCPNLVGGDYTGWQRPWGAIREVAYHGLLHINSCFFSKCASGPNFALLITNSRAWDTFSAEATLLLRVTV